MSIDLDSYFRRIGYTGSCTPTLDTLSAINRLHLQTIPYENINPLMKWPVPLDAQSLEQKLIRDGRGGYCYENNLLFSHVLRALGFDIRELSARAVWNQPENVPTARTHMILQVKLEEQSYIVDVGWGVASMGAPLRLEVDIEQSTPYGPWQLTKLDEEFVAKVKVDDK